MVQADIRTRGSLRRQWFVVATLYGAALLLGYQVVAGSAHTAHALRWLGLSAAVMGIQLAILWWALPFNLRPGGALLYPTLGLANSLTLARGALTCLLAGFLFSPPPAELLAWAPALLYGSERAIDFVDGWIARRTDRETELGSILDIEFDGLGLLIAVGLAVGYGALPGWYLLLGISRPLFVFGIHLRRRWGKPVFELPPSDHRRVIAGLQTGFISVVLWPLWSAEVTQLAGALFALPLALSFVRDWLVVSGRVSAESSPYRALRRSVKRWFEGALPLGLRMAGALLAASLLARSMSALWGGVVAVAALLLALGVVGRAAALLLLVVAALDAVAVGMRWNDHALLLICTIGVLHLGSGWLALWAPEERLIRLKLGAAHQE